MKKIFSILLLLIFVVGCAPKEAPMEEVKEVPVEEQQVEEVQETQVEEKQPVEEKPTQLKETEIAEKSPDVFYETQAECETAGGSWEKSPTDKNICNLKLPDAGKKCTDTIECNGLCVGETIEATEGRCSETQYLHSCVFYLEKGKVLGTLCFD